MGSDLYDVRVDRWSVAPLEEMITRAAQHGLSADHARACVRRGGDGDRAIEVDLHIRQIHPDASIWELDVAYMVMTFHAAGYWPAHRKHLQERLEACFGGFDSINSYSFAPGLDDACFAFSLLERGSEPGDPARYAVEGDAPAPMEDWARVRVWLSEDLGKELEGAQWSSRAWSPVGAKLWTNHFPPSGLASRIGEPRTLTPFPEAPGEARNIASIEASDSQLVCIEEETGAAVGFDRTSGEELWRRATLTEERYGATLGISRDGSRLYVGALRSWLGTTDAKGEGLKRLPDGASSSLLREDAGGTLFELQVYDEKGDGTDPGRVWLRDRATGERARLIAEHRPRPSIAHDPAEMEEHAFAAVAAVGASVTRKGDLVVWDRGGERSRAWLPEGDVSAIALSPDAGTVYVVYFGGRLLAWDVEKAEARWEEPLGGHGGGKLTLSLSPDGGTLAIGGSGSIQLFEVARRAVVLFLRASPERPQGSLYRLGFAPRGDGLYVAVEQKDVVHWPIRP